MHGAPAGMLADTLCTTPTEQVTVSTTIIVTRFANSPHVKLFLTVAVPLSTAFQLSLTTDAIYQDLATVKLHSASEPLADLLRHSN